MDTIDIIKKVRRIEIQSRRLSHNIFAGEYHSAFKGKGMTFSEVRDYQYGDDVRNIDWNVTARTRRTMVKVFEEEREMTMMLLVDVSASGTFGSTIAKKQEIMVLIAATIAFSANQNNDKIGVILFSDKIEKFIPPKKGRKHILSIISTLNDFKPESTKTDLGFALSYLTNAIKKHCTAFVISDFIDDKDMSQAMMIANKKHEIKAFQVYDCVDAELPKVGLIKMRDAESGQKIWVNSSSKKMRMMYARHWYKLQHQIRDYCTQAGVNFESVEAQEDYVPALMRLFSIRR